MLWRGVPGGLPPGLWVAGLGGIAFSVFAFFGVGKEPLLWAVALALAGLPDLFLDALATSRRTGRPRQRHDAPGAAGVNSRNPVKTPKFTSLEVAQLAQVSQATVSRALRDSPLVKPETRARIQEIAREMHYRTDRNAAGLRTRRSRTLALLLFEESPDEAQINPFFLSMIGHIARAAARRSFDLLMSFQQLSEDWHTDYETLEPRRRHDPARLRRLPEICGAAAASRGNRVAFRHLGAGGREPAGTLRLLRQRAGREARHGTPDAPGPQADRIRRRRDGGLAGVPAAPSGLCRSARGGRPRPGAAAARRGAEPRGRGLSLGDRAARFRRAVRRRVRGERPDRDGRDPRAAGSRGSVPQDVAVVGFDDIVSAADSIRR